MAQETNIRFKVNMQVDGKQQAVDLGMALGDLAQVTKAVDKANKNTVSSIAAVMTNMEYAVNAIGRLQSVMNDLSAAYAVQEQAETQLATAMRNTMAATDAQIQSIKDLASAQQELGVIGDEVQLQGAKQMATYLSQASSLEKLLPVINDVAVAQYGLNVSGQQLAGIADAIGKAMQGQDRALRRFGITLTDAQKEILKTGTESERTALLVELLGTKFDGANEAMRQTASGQAQAVSNWLGDLKEKLGQIVSSAMPAVNAIASFGMASTSFLQLAKATGVATLAQKTMAAVSVASSTTLKGVTVAVYSAARSMGVASVAARGLALAFKTLLIATAVGVAIWAVTEAIAAFVESADKAKMKTDELSEANDAFTETNARIRADIDMEITKLRNLIDAKQDTTKAVEELNNKYGEELGCQKDAATWLDVLTTKSEAYARAKALEAEAIALATRQYRLEQQQRDLLAKKKKMEDEGTDTASYMSAAPTYSPTVGSGMGGGQVMTYETSEYSEAKRQLADVAKELDDIAAKRNQLNADIASTTADLASGLTSTGKESPSSSSSKPKPDDIIPPGTIAAIEKRMSEINKAIKFEPDESARRGLFLELQELERQKHDIEFRYTFGAVTPSTLMAVALEIEDNAPDIRLPVSIDLPTTLPMPTLPTIEDTSYEDRMKAAAEAVKGTQSVMGEFAKTMSSLSSILGEGAGAWLRWGSNVLNAISQALPALRNLVAGNTAAAATSAAAQNAAAGPFGWIAGIAASASIVAALMDLPKFAEGGIAYGPTVGLFGEYAGASTNPEVVAPLDRLESLIQPAGGIGGEVVFRIDGRTLKGVLTRTDQFSQRRR